MLKPSDQLRGRANAFKADLDYLSAQIDSYSGHSDRELANMRDRFQGYRVVVDELRNLADELDRDGL